MPIAEYLRRQAENCLHIGRLAFDLGTAERLRHMAAELQAKADALDEEATLESRMTRHNGSSTERNHN